MSITRKLGTAVGGVLLAGVAVGGAPANASTVHAGAGGETGPALAGDTKGCFKAQDKGRTWEAHPAYPSSGHGTGRFSERGEYLDVWDTKSNNLRTVVLFSWCVNGSYVTYRHRDSGPNLGDIDHKQYNFDFKDGRKIKFRVCEKKMSTGKLSDCSGIVYAVA